MKKIIADNLLYAILYVLIVSAARFKLDFSLITFFLGGTVGSVVLLSDYLFQVFLVQPELEASQEAKRLAKEGKYLESVKLVFQRRAEIKSLTFHTIFFQVIFFTFSFFIITSSNSAFGKGLVLTALLCLLKEQILEIKNNKELDREWFQRININLTPKEQKIYLALSIVVFLVFTLIYI